jgi:microcystin synthetase protein McyA
MTWRYSENLHQHATIEALAQRFMEALKELIEHSLSAGAGGYTPSDFPEAQLSQKELDDLIAEIAGPFAEI